MNVHLSIDDVWYALYQLDRKKYKSVFDNSFFAFLRFLHRKYGCKFSLYLVAQGNQFSVSDMTNKYREEFRSNSDWLRFGFHCVSLKDANTDFEEFTKAFTSTIESIVRFAGSECLCDIIRLHGFYGSDRIIKVLKKNGIKGLLCADDERISYDLSEELNKKLNETGVIENYGMTYYRTNLRIENFSGKEMLKYRDCPLLIVFTHEWLFTRNGPFFYFKVYNFIKRINDTAVYCVTL